MVRHRIANPYHASSTLVAYSTILTEKKNNMKPSKTFKLSKTTKRRMATIVNAASRHEYKNAMIQAELAASVVIKSSKERDKQ